MKKSKTKMNAINTVIEKRNKKENLENQIELKKVKLIKKKIVDPRKILKKAVVFRIRNEH